MEKSAILNADLLDIVFEGRNKEYGAYELRKTYNRRLRISVSVMLLLIGMLCVGHLIASRLTDKDARVALIPADHQLEEVKLPEEEPLPPPPEVKPPPPQQVQTIAVTTPRIEPDDQVEKTEMPPLEDIETAKIDVVTKEGTLDDGIVAPPETDNGRDIVVAPKPVEEDLNTPFMKVEKESEYPGGRKAWERFLIKNLRIPQDAIDNNIGGTVVVQFVVDREGNVSKAEAISGPMELRPEAVRVIMKSGKWTPAIQNGKHVPSYKKQPITIQIMEE